MDEIKAALIQLINLAKRGRYDVDVQGAGQITAIITRATNAVQTLEEIKNDNETEADSDEG